MGVRYKRTPKFLRADILIMSSNTAINVQKKKFLKGSKAFLSSYLSSCFNEGVKKGESLFLMFKKERSNPSEFDSTKKIFSTRQDHDGFYSP